ncbi:MAG: hypothetical protein ACI3X3_01705, partial [Acidaminococcus sp.]|uniref:hypothetical protein n=1 Tax=Acidaminococcus sp. TaxID=1872103 RepID=UPI003F166767
YSMSRLHMGTFSVASLMGHPYENNGIYVKCVGATRQGSPLPGLPEGNSIQCQHVLVSFS